MRSTLATTTCCRDLLDAGSVRNHACKEHAGLGSVRWDLEMEGDGDARTAPSDAWGTAASRTRKSQKPAARRPSRQTWCFLISQNSLHVQSPRTRCVLST